MWRLEANSCLQGAARLAALDMQLVPQAVSRAFRVLKPASWPAQSPFQRTPSQLTADYPIPSASLTITQPQVLAIMDESIQVYSPELLQNRIAILR